MKACTGRGVPPDIIDVYVGVIPQAPFERATAVVVLDSIGIEHFQLPIVSRDGQLHRQLPIWVHQHILEPLIVIQLLKRLLTTPQTPHAAGLRGRPEALPIALEGFFSPSRTLCALALHTAFGIVPLAEVCDLCMIGPSPVSGPC